MGAVVIAALVLLVIGVVAALLFLLNRSKPSAVISAPDSAAIAAAKANALAMAQANAALPDPVQPATQATQAPANPIFLNFYQSYQGLDTAGTDVSQVTGGATTCAAACKHNTACQYFVTDAQGTTCWLKSNPGIVSFRNDRVSYMLTGTEPAAPATLFTACAYTNDASGQSVTITPGDYPAMPQGFPDDALSSVTLPPGFYMTLFSEANYQGTSIKLTSSTSCLADDQYKFNDMASSLKYHTQ